MGSISLGSCSITGFVINSPESSVVLSQNIGGEFGVRHWILIHITQDLIPDQTYRQIFCSQDEVFISAIDKTWDAEVYQATTMVLNPH